MIDFAVIGAQKSASTSLHNSLAAHPQVRMPPQEIPLFEERFFREANLRRFRNWASGHPQGGSIGIKRPDYLARREVPVNLATASAQARLIVVLRNPAERLHSALFHYMRLGLIPVIDPNTALRMIIRGDRLPGVPRFDELWSYGLYGAHLCHWLSFFDRSRFLVIETDELNGSEGNLHKEVAEFLEIGGQLPVVKETANSGVYDLRRIRLHRLRTSLGPSWENTSTLRMQSRYFRRPWWLPIAGAVSAADQLARVRWTTRFQADDDLLDQLLKRYIELDGPLLRTTAERGFSWLDE